MPKFFSVLRYLPLQFEDMNGIAVWMSSPSFLNMVDLNLIQEHYNKLLKRSGMLDLVLKGEDCASCCSIHICEKSKEGRT